MQHRQHAPHLLPRRLAAKPSGFMDSMSASTMPSSITAAFASLPRLQHVVRCSVHLADMLAVPRQSHVIHGNGTASQAAVSAQLL